MRNLIDSIKNFYSYPSKVTSLEKFFKYEELQKRFEFCPKGKDPDSDSCPVEANTLLHGDQAPDLCDKCIKEYLAESGLSEEDQKFLYERLAKPHDNTWILVQEDFSNMDARTGKRPNDK